MLYRIAIEQDLTQLSYLRWDFRMEGGGIPVVSKEELLRLVPHF